MCGLLGVINCSNTNHSYLNGYMKDGCITGVLRGKDSTGLFQVNDRKKEYDSFKLPYSGELFLEHKRAAEYFRRADEPGCTILHHRAATRGSVSVDNAHPFEHDNGEGNFIVGVHNGTLTSAHTNYDGLRFDVDSDYLLYRMMKEGANKTLSDIRGAVATIWYTEEHKLRLYTNGERSLFFGIVKDKNVALIASEAGMLYWLATRNGIELEAIIAPDKNVIHTFDFSTNVRDYERESVEVAPPTNFYQSTTTTKTTTRDSGYGQTHGTDKLAELGVKRQQRALFYPDGDYKISATKIHGYVEVNNDLLPAIMYGVTPYINQQVSSASWVEVEILAANTTNEQQVLIVSKPFMVVQDAASSDNLTDLEDKDDFPDVPAQGVPGPNGRILTLDKFFRMTTDGCMSCGGVITPKDAHEGKIQWVNNDQNAVCKNCVDDFAKAASK